MPSFNVQNAKTLSISEGDVKTINDSNGQLLWGAVGYSTKYEGDTEQQTYTGKNLWGGKEKTYASPIGFTATYNIDGTLSVTGTASSRTWAVLTNLAYDDNLMIELPAGTYTFTVWGGKETQLISTALDGTGETANVSVNSGAGSVKFTTSATRLFYPRIRIEAGATGYTVGFMIEQGSTPTPYEPYVGGIPSPNPFYPQPISVVTGTQTITLSDGTNTEDFTVSLGSEELCKIGTYQDYIWKDGSDWKVHKATGKMVLDGTEESWNRVQVSGVTRYFTVDATGALIVTDTSSLTPVVCDNFTSQTPSNIHLAIPDYGISLNTETAKFRFRDKDYTETSDFKTWLTTHNTTVYYALATATDTTITDTTLIGQLNAIEDWLTRYGYSATVSGSLPLIINQTALS